MINGRTVMAGLHATIRPKGPTVGENMQTPTSIYLELTKASYGDGGDTRCVSFFGHKDLIFKMHQRGSTVPEAYP